ncbi:hypothetical protein D9M68_493510 [compost metagenome]
MQFVGVSLDAGDLLGDGDEPVVIGADAIQQRDCLGNQMCGPADNRTHFAHAGVEGLLLVEPDCLDGFVHHVDGIIHRLDQILDVAAVEGGNERTADRQKHFGGNMIRFIFERDDPVALFLEIVATGEQLVERVGSTDDCA